MTDVGPFRFTGPVSGFDPTSRAAAPIDAGLREATAAIIARVRSEGDAALLAMAQEFDHVTLSALEVPRQRWIDATWRIPGELRAAIAHAVRNIRTAHEPFLARSGEVETEPGVIVGRRADPLRRVGVYAPGGRASYPSSLLMGVVPARVAGVTEVIVCSPPTGNGAPADAILAAAEMAHVDRVFAVGGAGAIAALAYGTATVPRVDRIVGPGNAYVAEAKLQVANVVGIDTPAGPSELLVIVDGTGHPEGIAREVLAQAEHDPDAAVVVVALGAGVAEKIGNAVAARLPAEPRAAIIQASLSARGALLVAASIDEAVTLANAWAPEHLLLVVADPSAAFARVRGAGTVFFGETSSVVFGDYMTGANHVLPTGGLGRSYSGLSTLDFVRWTTYQRVDRPGAAALAPDAVAFATAEGLSAHAAAAAAFEERTS